MYSMVCKRREKVNRIRQMGVLINSNENEEGRNGCHGSMIDVLVVAMDFFNNLRGGVNL